MSDETVSNSSDENKPMASEGVSQTPPKTAASTCCTGAATKTEQKSPVSPNKAESSDDQMNSSGGESTGVLLTKALKTLVRPDYDVITPPRQTTRPRDQEQQKKKIALFRPYELDNGMSGDRKCSLPVQSPMLLRSNYGTTGPQWLIERRHKSEAIFNRFTEKDASIKSSELNSANEGFLVSHKIGNCGSESDKEIQDTVTLKKAVETNLSSGKAVPVSRKKDHTTVLPHVQPLRASTPKNSPCPSPNIPSSKSEVSCSLPKHLPSPVINVSVCDIKNDNEVLKNLYSIGTDSEQSIVSSHVPSYYSQAAIQVRSLAEEGHRLPLKHSYKHLPPPTPVGERPRSPFPEANFLASTSQDRSRTPTNYGTVATERFRSNSCPPYSAREGVPKAVDLSDPGISGHKDQLTTTGSGTQKTVFSNTTKNYIEAVKETWAMHHAVMTSQTPKHEKHVLPSFSTFSGKTSRYDKGNCSRSVIADDRRLSDKHSRSKSEGTLELKTETSKPSERSIEQKAMLQRVGPPILPRQFVVPMQCFKNFAIEKSNSSHSCTWHVPETDVRHSNLPSLERRPPSSQSNYTSSKQILSNTSVSIASKPSMPAQTNRLFNPSVDIYKDPATFKPLKYVPSQSVHQQAVFDPRYMCRLSTMTPAYLNPLTVKAYKPELMGHLVPRHMTSPSRRPTSSSYSVKQIDGTTQSVDRYQSTERVSGIDHFRPGHLDPRQPLGTSALQNQSPLASPVPQDPKVNTVMTMVKVMNYPSVL